MDEEYRGCRRTNYVHAAYVEAAIHINKVLGSDRAYWILIRENVPASVIDRIVKSQDGRLRRKDRRYAARRATITGAEQDPLFDDQRGDQLTSQRIEVALVFKTMLGTDAAAEYLRKAGVPIWTTARVLGSAKRRPSPAIVVE
ncbi:hypothetical protein [Pseudoduganella umbonata]|uniref:Putative GNAT superfamily acetyltransferase n=1 Tax=Pseudoduganella umbonata TaxID=864828 RepID=A0A4P8HT12_9BURK|nr:hypothetical protein [Pseudoduganella umbonata]MBB3220722.1 putative GNAT superfamily acetyltransferase [Pseudoduganella umbonata]QCP11798.1 hypothetical protein FCL38_16260 [Pseudoduganella umbonata]